MRIGFRADAALTIGTGHVMRCLTLARELATRGHTCHFVCRDLPGDLNAQVAQEFPLTVLPAPSAPLADGAPDERLPAHAAWAGVSWAQDAAETRAALGPVDWLVADHYAFDARWEQAACPAGAQLMVIDDLADRPHACALLLDANLGRTASDYETLLPPSAERLTGPRHALLRPEFARTRAIALARRGGALRHVLIAPGGVDADNVTGRLLVMLASLPLPDPVQVTVALGPTAPHVGDLQAMDLPFRCQIRAGVADMAALMADADLCIGAAGGSTWERCALGLPTLILVLADNQEAGAAALVDAGAALALGRPDGRLAERLAAGMRQLSDPAALAAASAAAARLCDGKGTGRVADALETPLHLRPATASDAEAVWQWRAALPAEHFRAGPNPTLRAHRSWWDAALAAPGRHLLMAADLAHLRLDLEDSGARVSLLLAPHARGRGLGRRLLARLDQYAQGLGLQHLIAEVAKTNPASAEVFSGAGYTETARTGGFRLFIRHLHSTPRHDTSEGQETP